MQHSAWCTTCWAIQDSGLNSEGAKFKHGVFCSLWKYIRNYHLGRNLIWLRCLGRLIRHTTALACEAISRDHWFRWEAQSWTRGAPSHGLEALMEHKGRSQLLQTFLSSPWASWGEQVHSTTCSCMLMFHNTRPWLQSQATVDWNPQSHSQKTSFHLEG